MDLDVNINNKNLEKLTKQKKEIKGDFDCSHNNLTSLEGCPEIVLANFNCSYNNLSSLKYSPRVIYLAFDCTGNKELKNIKEQVIKYGIKASIYRTDEGEFIYANVEKEIKQYKKQKLKEINNLKKVKENIKIINKNDYGLGI